MSKPSIGVHLLCSLLLPWLASVALAAGASDATPGVSPVSPPYTSAFADYRRYTDQSVTSWTTSNKLVGRIGGWQAYAREAQAPSAAKPPAADKPAMSAVPQPQPAGHKSHH